MQRSVPEIKEAATEEKTVDFPIHYVRIKNDSKNSIFISDIYKKSYDGTK
jgi:hypothetical protein